MIVDWIKCVSDTWCGFLNVNLDNEHFESLSGVYIIWSGTTTIRVGSGVIKVRISNHRDNSKITNYPDLLVTWASVNANQMEGVEKYLADTLSPIVGERFPNRTPIEVNLPWT